jgi:exosortase A
MLIAPQRQTVALEARAARQAWLPAGLCLGLAVVALGILFHAEVAGAYRVWETSTAYNHCFLVLPVAAYLAWTRRDGLAGLTPQPDLRMLALLVPLSLAWLLAAMLGVLEAQQLLVVAMLQVMALAVLGSVIYRVMLTPFLYLFFLIPTGYFLVPYLQTFTAWFTVMGLRLARIPVFWDGTIIQIPAGTFVVAEACAGLRFLVASVAFGVFFAALMYRSRIRWLLFVVLSVVIPVVANGFRAFGLLILAQTSGNTAMVMADHVIYGWGFFSAVTLSLIFIGKAFADNDGGAVPGNRLPRQGTAAVVPQTWKLAVVALLSFSLAAVGPAYARMLEWGTATIDLAAAPSPEVDDGWRKSDWQFDWKPSVHAPDREFLDAFDDAGAHVARYVALYVTAGLHNNLARGQNEIADFERWHLIGTGRAQARIGGKDVTVETTAVETHGRRLRIWDFYIVDNEIVAGRTAAKFAQLRGLLTNRSPMAAFVAIAADDSDPARPAAEALTRFLDAMPAWPRYFQTLTSGKPTGR